MICTCLTAIVATALMQAPADTKGAPRAVQEFVKSRPAPRPATPPSPVAPPPKFTPAPPNEPTRIALDFKDQPVGQVVRAIGARSGGMVELTYTGENEPPWGQARITLEVASPVPFWEAIDRLSTVGKLQHHDASGGMFATTRPRLQIQSSYVTEALDRGPAAYVGAFRLGPVVIHERFERVFATPRRATGLGYGFNDPTPRFHAEIPLAAEPGLLFRRVAPMKGLVAVDDAGQSLLDPSAKGEEATFGQAPAGTTEPKALIVAMVRPSKPSKMLATLKGLVPLEVGRRPLMPTTLIALEGSSGKTTRDGEIALTVREFKANPSGQTTLKLTIKAEGKGGGSDVQSRGLRDARLWSILNQQLDLADADGKPVSASGGGGPNAAGEMNLDYHFSAYPVGTKVGLPTQLRIYRPDWVAWNLPFEFKDLTLP